MSKLILQLDGGGAKGIIQIEMLTALELELGKPLCEVFDLIVGTSVGAIIGGLIASGKVPMTEIRDMFYNVIPIVFKKPLCPAINVLFNIPFYSRKIILNAIKSIIPNDILMSECKTKFMATAISANDYNNHYFKSWETKDGQLKLLDVINYSFAAPVLFGLVNDPIHRTTYGDGGMGNSNCSLSETIIETIRQTWLMNDNIFILSIGSGYSKLYNMYNDTKDWDNFKSIFSLYSDIGNGGLARSQSVNTQEIFVKSLQPIIPNLHVNRINNKIDDRYMGMDNIDNLSIYTNYGKLWYNEIDIKTIKEYL